MMHWVKKSWGVPTKKTTSTSLCRPCGTQTIRLAYFFYSTTNRVCPDGRWTMDEWTRWKGNCSLTPSLLIRSNLWVLRYDNCNSWWDRYSTPRHSHSEDKPHGCFKPFVDHWVTIPRVVRKTNLWKPWVACQAQVECFPTIYYTVPLD